MAPQVTESVVAVDPVSERALLGTAGDFLAPLEKAPPADARNAGAIGRHFESLFTNGISMDELKEGPDFLGVKLKYWAPLMTQYQQAKRNGQLTEDSQAIPLIVRSGHLPGPEVLGQDRGNRRLRQRRQGRRHRDPLAGQGLPAVRLQVPVRPGLARVHGPTPSSWATPANFSQGLYNPATWSTELRRRPEVHRRRHRRQRRRGQDRHARRLGHREPASGEGRQRRSRRPDPARAGRRALLPREPRNRQEARHAAGHGLRHVRPRRRSRKPPATSTGCPWAATTPRRSP